MKKVLKKLMVFLVIFMLICIGITNTTAYADDTVAFKDSNLESLVRNALNKPSGSITQNDMLSLTNLSGSYQNITDLTGLQYATNLTHLDLSNNKITNIDCLSSLTDLWYLDLSYNQISDLSSIGYMTRLSSLYLRNNQISDISLLEGCTQLLSIGLSGNKISNLYPLSNFSNLRNLDLDRNLISDVRPLQNDSKIYDLSLRYNKISDIGPLVTLSANGAFYDNHWSKLYLDGNYLDLSYNSKSYNDLQTLKGRDVPVTYYSQIVTVDSLAPENNAVGVKVGSTITINFSRVLDKGDNFDKIVVYDQDINDADIDVSLSDKTLTITPKKPLKYSSQYTVRIPYNAFNDDYVFEDEYSDYSFTFTTEPDTYPPSLVSSTPLSGKQNVKEDSTIVFSFNEPVKTGSGFNSIKMEDRDGKSVSATASIEGNNLKVKPNRVLDNYMTYSITAPVNVVTDTADNNLTAALNLSFTTKAPGDLLEGDIVLGQKGEYNFAGIYEYNNLTIDDNTKITNNGISQLVIKVNGTLTLGKNVAIRVRNGFYPEAPENSISSITPLNLNMLGEEANGIKLYPNTFGKGGNGGKGGQGGAGINKYLYVGYGSGYYMNGDGGGGGGGGAGGYGGGTGGDGGHGGIGANINNSDFIGHNGAVGYPGADNGGDGGEGGGGNINQGLGGGATLLGGNGTMDSSAYISAGGGGGGGNGGNGGSGNNNAEVSANGALGGTTGGGGSGGGGGGYGGGVLTIIADKIVYDKEEPPKFLVSGQKGGLASSGLGLRALKGTNGQNGQGGIIIINTNGYEFSLNHWNLDTTFYGSEGHSTSNGGHGVVTGNPQKVFINGVQIINGDEISLPVKVEKGTLTIAINVATALLNSKTIGTEVGNVPQAAHDAFNAVIEAASTVAADTNATQAAVDSAVIALKKATTIFNRSVIPNQIVKIMGNKISGGSEHSLALKTNGTVVAWGSDSFGQSTVPEGPNNVMAVSAGFNYSLALKSDGTVVAWGVNDSGQCDVPEGLNSVVAIAAGALHSLALKSDGTVVAWGANSDGQCNVPEGLNNVTAIANGGFHSLALKSDGTVVAWGYAGDGECDIPEGLGNVTAIAAGEGFSLALKSDGTVAAWGYNYDGECNVPTGLSNVVKIAVGGCHSLALKNDGTVVAWGYNDDGQCNVPSELKNIEEIAAGEFHSLALKKDGTMAAWGKNASWQSSIPEGLKLSVTAPVVNGVVNGQVYTGSVTPNWTDETGITSTATLDGAAYTKGTAISTEGNHTLVVTAKDDANGLTAVTTVNFTINIPIPDSVAVENDKAALTLGDTASVTSNLTLPLAGGNGTVISWSSNNTKVVTNSGEVIRPTLLQGDAVVTLTATIKKGNDSGTKIFTVTVKASNNIIYGDVDGDGTVTSSDYELVKKYLLGEIIRFPVTNTEAAYTAADADGDGKITSSDYALVEKHVNGEIDNFPAETK